MTLVVTVRVCCIAPNLASACTASVHNTPFSNSLINVCDSEEDGSHVIFSSHPSQATYI